MGGADGSDQGAEERAAISVLLGTVETTLHAISPGGGGLQEPAHADMITFKAEDDTRDADEGSW